MAVIGILDATQVYFDDGGSDHASIVEYFAEKLKEFVQVIII